MNLYQVDIKPIRTYPVYCAIHVSSSRLFSSMFFVDVTCARRLRCFIDFFPREILHFHRFRCENCPSTQFSRLNRNIGESLQERNVVDEIFSLSFAFAESVGCAALIHRNRAKCDKLPGVFFCREKDNSL